MFIRIVFILSFSLHFITESHSATVIIEPSRDNTLYESATGDLSNGAGTHMFVGLTGPNAGTLIRRGIVAFNLPAQIDSGSIINSVSLQMTLSQSPPMATPIDVSLHTVTSAWGEGASDAGDPGGAGDSSSTNDATWQHSFFDSTFWNAEGGDLLASPRATTSVNLVGDYSWSTANMAADVQSWLDSPADNHGWIIIGNEGTASTARRFETREHSVPQVRPQLTIDFTPSNPPPPLAGPISVPALNATGLIAMISLILLVTQRLYKRTR